ncbi:hypothetical protein TWF281_011280 [Arthrobotrys megalospora]
MQNPTFQVASRAILLIAVISPIASAWFMQLKTTQEVQQYVGGRLTTEPIYLYQNDDNPLTFSSCIKIDYGNFRNDAKIDYFTFARDPPTWDDSKTKEENLLTAVRGLAFFQGDDCQPLTTRVIFRLNDDYAPGSYLFLASKAITPPLQLGSWRPIWLHGQGSYSESLEKMKIGGFKLFPPPEELLRIVQEQQTLPTNQQQQQAPRNSADAQLQTQKQAQGFIPIQPGTGQQTSNLGNLNRLNQLAGLNQQRREEGIISEILRNKPREQDEEVFEEEKQQNIDLESPQDEFMSPGYQTRVIQDDPGDISNFFAARNDQGNTGNWYNPQFQFSGLGSINQGSLQLQEENLARNQDNAIQEEEALEQAQTAAVEQGNVGNIQQPKFELSGQGTGSRNAPEIESQSNQIVEEIEVPRNQATGSQVQSQGNNEAQGGSQPSGNQIGMPPPNRPPQHQAVNTADMSLMLENNRLRFANKIEHLSGPYLDAMYKTLAQSGQLIHNELVKIARDPNTENIDQYLGKVEEIMDTRKKFLAMNEDKYLEALRLAVTKLKEGDSRIQGAQNPDANTQPNPSSQQNTGPR